MPDAIKQLQHFHQPEARGPMVVKIGGAALDGMTNSTLVAATIASLRARWAGLLVVVHGGGVEVDRHLARLGLVSEKREGIRLTPAEHIDEVVAVLAGKMNRRLVGALQHQGVRAVGLCIGDGGLLRTVKATHYSFDPGQVGCAIDGDPSLVQLLGAGGFLPVVCSIGVDDCGNALNVNADEAATAIARVLHASNLILLTDVPGVMDSAGRVLDQLTSVEVERRIAGGEIAGGMIPKARGAASIADELAIPVTIASWRDAAVGDHAPQSAGSAVGAWFGTRIVPHADAPGVATVQFHSAAPPFALAAATSGSA